MSEAENPFSGIPEPQDVPPRNAMDVFIDGIELIAASSSASSRSTSSSR